MSSLSSLTASLARLEREFTSTLELVPDVARRQADGKGGKVDLAVLRLRRLKEELVRIEGELDRLEQASGSDDVVRQTVQSQRFLARQLSGQADVLVARLERLMAVAKAHTAAEGATEVLSFAHKLREFDQGK